MMQPDPSMVLDLSTEQVRLLLAQQGYTIPEIELREVTASLNALVEGLTHLEGFEPLREEPWPTMVGYMTLPTAPLHLAPGSESSRPATQAGSPVGEEGGSDRAR